MASEGPLYALQLGWKREQWEGTAQVPTHYLEGKDRHRAARKGCVGQIRRALHAFAESRDHVDGRVTAAIPVDPASIRRQQAPPNAIYLPARPDPVKTLTSSEQEGVTCSVPSPWEQETRVNLMNPPSALQLHPK